MEQSDKPIKMNVISTTDDEFNLKTEKKIFKCHENAYKIKNRLNKFTNSEIEHAKNIIKGHTERLKEEWPALFYKNQIDKIYVHADLDAFYASCEILKNPKYKDVPIGIGSSLMLATSNYEARKYGVKAGMPGYMAKRLCPQLIIVKPNFVRYNYYSEMVMNILSQYDRNVEIYGIDEVCLVFDKKKLEYAYSIWNTDKTVGKSIINDKCENEDYFDGELNFKNVEWIVEKIRKVVHRNTGLTISAGLSVCRGLAKYASNINKPNGQFSITENFESFLSDLKVDEINGIGKYTKEMLLKTFNIETINDLREKNHLLFLTLPLKSFLNLFRLSFGLITFDGKKIVERLSQIKSHGKDLSITATDNLTDLLDLMWDSSGGLEQCMANKKQFAAVVTLKLRFTDFESLTKQRKLKSPIKHQLSIFNTAFDLLNEIFNRTGESEPLYKTFNTPKKINLLGIRVSSLIDESKLTTIFSFEGNRKKSKSRICPICSSEFFMEPQIFVDRHVETCIKNNEIKMKKRKQTLFHYILKRT